MYLLIVNSLKAELLLVSIFKILLLVRGFLCFKKSEYLLFDCSQWTIKVNPESQTLLWSSGGVLFMVMVSYKKSLLRMRMKFTHVLSCYPFLFFDLCVFVRAAT